MLYAGAFVSGHYFTSMRWTSLSLAGILVCAVYRSVPLVLCVAHASMQVSVGLSLGAESVGALQFLMGSVLRSEPASKCSSV